MMFHGRIEDMAELRREEIRREIAGDQLMALARRERKSSTGARWTAVVAKLMFFRRGSIQRKAAEASLANQCVARDREQPEFSW
jgi:hypothetical protein